MDGRVSYDSLTARQIDRISNDDEFTELYLDFLAILQGLLSADSAEARSLYRPDITQDICLQIIDDVREIDSELADGMEKHLHSTQHLNQLSVEKGRSVPVDLVDDVVERLLADYDRLRQSITTISQRSRAHKWVHDSHVVARGDPTPMRGPKVLVCYSHADSPWLDQLMISLKGLGSWYWIDVWADTRISPGQDWYAEIQGAIERADVAICLVSAHFLASVFCQQAEFPLLLKLRCKRGLLLLPILISDCVWDYVPWLASIQMWPRGGQTVADDWSDRKDKVFADVARDVGQHVVGLIEELAHNAGTPSRKDDDRLRQDLWNWHVVEQNLDVFEDQAWNSRGIGRLDEIAETLSTLLLTWFAEQGVSDSERVDLTVSTMASVSRLVTLEFGTTLSVPGQFRRWCLEVAADVQRLSAPDVVSEHTDLEDAGAMVPDAMLQLTEEHRQVLQIAVLHIGSDQVVDFGRIASSIGVSQNEAKQRLMEAVENLRRLMKQDLNR